MSDTPEKVVVDGVEWERWFPWGGDEWVAPTLSQSLVRRMFDGKWIGLTNQGSTPLKATRDEAMAAAAKVLSRETDDA